MVRSARSGVQRSGRERPMASNEWKSALPYRTTRPPQCAQCIARAGSCMRLYATRVVARQEKNMAVHLRYYRHDGSRTRAEY
eukprot:9491972-Pyramimonas_sp.AAC.2